MSLLPSALARRALMGMAMGITAFLIIHSPMGKRSGAHFNPSITLTYLRLGKIGSTDAACYVLFQFAGAIFGVALTAIASRGELAQPSVNYAVTFPGPNGVGAAFLAEFFMASVLMWCVLWMSNRPPVAKYTSYAVGILIVFYILLFAPVSGFSINPARTTGSAVLAHLWTACWIYFVAPVIGMFAAAECYLFTYGGARLLCAKLHPDPKYPCPFKCQYPDHHHKHPSR